MVRLLRKSRVLRLLLSLPPLIVLAFIWELLQTWEGLSTADMTAFRFAIWCAAGISIYILALRLFGYDPPRFSKVEQYRYLGREGPGPKFRQWAAVMVVVILAALTAAEA